MLGEKTDKMMRVENKAVKSNKSYVAIYYVVFVVIGDLVCLSGIIRSSKYIQEQLLQLLLMSCSWFLVAALLFPVFDKVVRGFKNREEGRKFFARDGEKRPMSGWTKFLLLIVGYDLFFVLVKAVLCGVDPRSCGGDGFGLFMIMAMALMCGLAIFVFIKVVVQVTWKVVALLRASRSAK